jgi:hypothetical protein
MDDILLIFLSFSSLRCPKVLRTKDGAHMCIECMGILNPETMPHIPSAVCLLLPTFKSNIYFAVDSVFSPIITTAIVLINICRRLLNIIFGQWN